MFSVVIPYYKKRRYIERCIEGVLSQTFKSYEIIVVDDGSHDDLKDLIERKYERKVQLIEQVNQGVSAARNKGILAATHDFIALLDADDFWSPLYLEYVAQAIRLKDCDIIAVNFSNNIHDLELNRSPIRKQNYSIDDYLLKSSYSAVITSSSVVVSNKLIHKAGLFDISLKHGEDIEMWLRLVLNSEKFVKIDNRLAYYDIAVENQAISKKTDFRYSFASKLEQLSKVDERHRKFAVMFMYARLFSYSFSNPEKASYFIDVLKLDNFIFSFYRIKPKYYILFNNAYIKKIVNKYLVYTVKYIR